MSTEPKVAVITGASGGISSGLVKAYRARAYRVVAMTLSAMPADDDDVLVVSGDIVERKTAERAISHWLTRFGRIDTLVNNAGIFISMPFTQYTEADFTAMLGVNLAGFFHITQLAIGRYPAAYFPERDVSPHVLQRTEHTTRHADLGLTRWYAVRVAGKSAPRGAWEHIGLPVHASELRATVAFAWPAMDAFYEEDERTVGHAADAYHRIDNCQSSHRLVVRYGDGIVVDTERPLVLYESGFALRWYVPRADIDESALTPVERQTFCPYKGLCSCYDIGDARPAPWSYREAYAQVGRFSDLVSFEPDVVPVRLDDIELRLEPGQTVIPHGPDRVLTATEALRPASGRV